MDLPSRYFVKIDFLALGALSQHQEALQLVDSAKDGTFWGQLQDRL